MARSAGPDAFRGFGPDTLAFLRELSEHNDRAWFEANRDRHERWLRTPMRDLLHDLEGLFGPSFLFRAHRDLRFTNDKRPYKESVSGALGGRRALVRSSVHLTAERLRVAAGARTLEGEHRTAYRRAVDAEASGAPLTRIVRVLEAEGYAVAGRTLKRGPRDAPPDHPRLDLLKHTRLQSVVEYPVGDWLYDPAEVLPRVIAPLADAEPLMAWLREHVT